VADDMKSLLEAIDLENIPDPNIRRVIVAQLNLTQHLMAENARLREEIQRLRDEVARLKGEQGKPGIKPGKKKKKHSSEKERKIPKKRTRQSKSVEIDRTVHCPIVRETLPEDAQYKGTERLVVEDVLFRRDNVAFEREKYYSPSQGKTFYGPLPQGYDGSSSFGPGVRSLVLMLYYATGTSEPKILELLDHVGVKMSAGTLSNLLIHDIEQFHQERQEIHRAGLESGPWHGTDDTGQRVDGSNQYCHVLGNEVYSIYQTMPRKDRPSVLAVLRGTETPRYLVDDNAIALAASFGVSGSVLGWFQERLPWNHELDEESFLEVYAETMSFVGGDTKRKLLTAAALAAYQAQDDVPVVDTLLCDDACQFKGLTDARALCWVHDGRHYAKLTPMHEPFRKEKDKFLDRYWDFYRELRDYRLNPSEQWAEELRKAFDKLVSTETDYDDLAKRIAKTKANKDELLLVLDHPELPLHNNDSELTVRQRKRKQDVSLSIRTTSGGRAWDTMQSIVGTTKKLGINIYEYLKDRVTGGQAVPRLADVIRVRAAEMNLGGSWA
jgi:hypothetical protein